MPYDGGPMTEAMYYVLLALVHPSHGYQLMNEIEEVSKGRVKMGPGTLYGVLSRLMKDELITVVNDDGRRKTYSITEDGISVLKIEYNRLMSMVNDGIIIKEGNYE